MSKGREEEAMAFLVKYHGNGDPEDALVLFEFEEMKAAITIEKVPRRFLEPRISHRLIFSLLLGAQTRYLGPACGNSRQPSPREFLS